MTRRYKSAWTDRYRAPRAEQAIVALHFICSRDAALLGVVPLLETLRAMGPAAVVVAGPAELSHQEPARQIGGAAVRFSFTGEATDKSVAPRNRTRHRTLAL